MDTTELEEDLEELYQTEDAYFESGSCLRFQPDTGAQSNVLPLHIYRKATNDKKLRKRTSAADGTSGVWEH